MSKNDKLPVAIYGSDGAYIEVGESKIPCYILDNGQRVLSRGGMLDALGLSYGTTGKRGADRLASFVGGKRVSKFISSDLAVLIENPITFIIKGSAKSYGYDALILQQIVRGVAKAFISGSLQTQQEHIGRNAEILDDAFSKLGIIALIDEATGYQKDVTRAKDEYKQFIAKFVLKEHAKWIKTFPDEFFEMIFRMKGWTWVGIKRSKKPQVLGHYINDIIYSRLAPIVLSELKRKNPTDPTTGKRKTKHHQWLSPNLGHPKLREHLSGVLALGRASGYDWEIFYKMLNRSYPKYGQTLEILFPDQELLDPSRGISDFDQKLKKALDYNPKAEKEED